MISIVVPAYNARADLPMCLASLLAQSFEDWECVIVDDGSREPLDDLVTDFDDPRFRLVRHPTNRGRGAARATGLAETTRPLIAWQDADDWSYPDRLAAQLATLQATPEVDAVATGVAVIDAGGNCVGVRGDRPIAARRLAPLELPPVVHPTLLMRREVIASTGYRARFRTAEDHDFLTRALHRHAFANLAEPLYAYREAPSQSVRKYWESTRTRLVVAAEHAPRHPVRAAGRALSSLGKLGVYSVVSLLGGQERLIAARSRTPQSDEAAAFEVARARVRGLAAQRVGAAP